MYVPLTLYFKEMCILIKTRNLSSNIGNLIFQMFRRGLVKMFEGMDQDIVFMETSMGLKSFPAHACGMCAHAKGNRRSCTYLFQGKDALKCYLQAHFCVACEA